MKKLFKYIFISILVICAIVGTSWIFYSTLTKEREVYSQALSFQYSSSRVEISSMLNVANSDEIGNGRFNDIVLAYSELDNICGILTPYLAHANEYNYNQNEIYNRLENVRNMHSSIRRMLNEYISKSKSNQFDFDELTGANPVYTRLSKYLVNYSKYLLKINLETNEAINNKSDLKFYAIDIYLNVVIDTFADVNEDLAIVKVKSTENLESASSCFNFSSSVIGNYSNNVNIFIKNYKKCDSIEFAQEFAKNYKATEEVDDLEYRTMILLKKAMEV